MGPSEYAGDIPPSCSAYVNGCNQAFYDFYRRNILLLSLIGLVFGLFQVWQHLYFNYGVKVSYNFIIILDFGNSFNCIFGQRNKVKKSL